MTTENRRLGSAGNAARVSKHAALLLVVAGAVLILISLALVYL